MVGLILSAVIGITLGLIGGGGSIIAISILIYIIGIDTHQAIVMSLAIVGFLTGFLGVGGDLTVMPALMIFHGLSSKDAIGTHFLLLQHIAAPGCLVISITEISISVY